MEAETTNSNTSLLFLSDFSGFDQLGPRDGSSSGCSEVDSDVEDAIYAHMYFEEFPAAQAIPAGENSNQQSILSVTPGDDISSQGGGGLSVSLLLDTPKSKVKKKKKRRNNKKRTECVAPPPQPTGAATVAGGSPSDNDDGTTTATDSQDEVIQGIKVNEGANESETDSRLIADLSDNLIKEEPGTARKQVIKQIPSENVIVISSDSDVEIAVKGSKFSNGTEQSDDDIEIVSSDGSESSEESEGEEQGAGLKEAEEEGEASSDMQLSDQEQEGDNISLDPWHVNLKDQLGRDEYARRYGDTKSRFYGKNTGKCANCKQRYHTARNCPWPKRHQVCYLCGGADHISSQCPNDLCTYCYQEKHRGRSCSAPWASPKTQCLRCFMTGHHASICPDLWRQFHNTTYTSDDLAIIEGHDQRRCQCVFCCNCSLPGHYCFECPRTRPRGWPQPHLPLIAKYDLNVWPPPNIKQLREQMGISKGQEVTENHLDYEQRKQKLSREEMMGDSPRKRSRGGRDRKRKGDGAGRGNDFEERRKNMDKISIGTHPALKKKHHSAAENSSKLLDRRSNSLSDVGSASRGSSLLSTPTHAHNNTWSHSSPHSSSLLPTPVTPSAGLMLPPLQSHSNQSSERRAGEKRPRHHSQEYHHHRRDSEPVSVKRPRLTEHRHSLGVGTGEDFPREPLFATPPPYHGHTLPQHSSTPYSPGPPPPPPPPRRAYSDVNERLHYHRDSHHTHFNDQPHSSREMYKDEHHPNSIHKPHTPHHEDARKLLNRRMSYNEGHNRGVLPPYHRRLSDISEQSGGIRTPPTVAGHHDNSRHKRHRTEDGWMVNDRGFRGPSHLLRNDYRH